MPFEVSQDAGIAVENSQRDIILKSGGDAVYLEGEMGSSGGIATDTVQSDNAGTVNSGTNDRLPGRFMGDVYTRTDPVGGATNQSDSVSFARVVKGDGHASAGPVSVAPQSTRTVEKEAGNNQSRDIEQRESQPDTKDNLEESRTSTKKVSSGATHRTEEEVPDRNSSLSAPPDLEISSRALFAFKAGYTSAFTDMQQQIYNSAYNNFVEDGSAGTESNNMDATVGRELNQRLSHLSVREPGMKREDSDASVEDLILRASRMPPLSASNLARDDSEISLTSLAHPVDMGADDSYLRDRGFLSAGGESSKSGLRGISNGMSAVMNTEMWKQIGGMPNTGAIDGTNGGLKDGTVRPSPAVSLAQTTNMYFFSQDQPISSSNSNVNPQYGAFQHQSGPWSANGSVQVEYSPFRPAFPAAISPYSTAKLTPGLYNTGGGISSRTPGYESVVPRMYEPALNSADYGAFNRGIARGPANLHSGGVPGDSLQFEKGRGRHVSFSSGHPQGIARPVKPGVVGGPVNGAVKYTHFSEAVGRVKELARDQHGCRYLQTKLEEGNPQYINVIFDECFDEFVDLMVDPFGNYLCQKLFEHCDDEQRLILVQYCAESLGRVSANMHGTRAVQRMVECLSTPEQISTACKALAPSAVFLMKDINGNHVIQRCLQRMDSTNNQFVYDAVANNCFDLATHRHGCCVMQRCIDYASPAQKNQLVKQVTSNALLLVQNPFGNYVVQYVLELGDQGYTLEIIKRLQSHVGELSTQKFSSNVVEKCLQQGNAETRSVLIDELISDSDVIGRLLHDAFGNYVIQRSLQLARSPQLEALCEAIRPHLPSLKSSPYGKRIQSKILKRFPKNRGDRDEFNL